MSNLNSAFATRLRQRQQGRRRDRGSGHGAGTDLPCVLVVDDEQEITRSVTEMLHGEANVVAAHSADDALEVLARREVALILTDQRMPGGTGTELLARAIDVAPETTRILFTGYSDITAVIDAVNRGQVFRYVAKPWDPRELRDVLTQGLDRYELVTENQRLMAELTAANADLELRVAERTRRLEEQNKELREAREQIEELSRRDALTDLTNRRWLDEVLQHEIARAARYEAPFSVVMADLDHFKEVNDGFGHAAGDQVLRAVAKSLEKATRVTDVVGRYGGDEFLILLPKTDLERATVLAQRIRFGVSLIPQDFQPLSLTISIGIAQWQVGDTVPTLIDRADQALYEAKRAGRDQIHVATELPALPSPTAQTTLEAFLGENHDAVVGAVTGRLRGSRGIPDLARQQHTTEGQMLGQVLGFWLQAIRTDVALGTSTAIESNLAWLVRFRDGQNLEFDDSMVRRMFDDISSEIIARLESDDLRKQFSGYRAIVNGLISESFPQASGP